MQCQGECHKTGECAGEVQKVTVSGFGISGWNFAYCETAVEIDRSKGFTVVLEADQETEGDLEAIERQQEQAARLRDEAEQNQDDEDPFGEHWQKLMRQHSKADLVFALKTALEREAKLGRTYNHLLSSVEGMQAEIDRCYEAMDSRKAIS